MARINHRIQQSIISKIEESAFSTGPFEFEFPESDTIAIITVKNEADYHFKIKHLAGNNTFETSEKPGEVFSEDVSRHQNLGSAIDRVGIWTNNLTAEYKARSLIYGEFERAWKNIEEQMQAHSEDDGLHFTQGEKEQIFSRLDELEKKYEELFEKKKISQEQLNSFKSTIQEAEEQTDVLPKGVWFRTFSRKIYNIGKFVLTSKEARQLLLMEAKHFLLPSSENLHQ